MLDPVFLNVFSQGCYVNSRPGKVFKNFDSQVHATQWIPMAEGEEVEIKKDILIRSIRNHHVPSPDSIIKSCGYLIQHRKFKLKQEYLRCPAHEIIQLRKKLGEEQLTQEVRANILGYSGDTPVENFPTWNNTETLIHEATFLSRAEIAENDRRRNKHSVLEDVLQAAASANIQRLVIGHISSRYQPGEIDKCITKNCQRYHIQFPVFRIMPGEYLHNITSTTPVNCG